MNCEICGKDMKQVTEKRGLEGGIEKPTTLWACACGFAKDTEVMPSVVDNAIQIKALLEVGKIYEPRENWLPPTNEIDEGIYPPLYFAGIPFIDDDGNVEV